MSIQSPVPNHVAAHDHLAYRLYRPINIWGWPDYYVVYLGLLTFFPERKAVVGNDQRSSLAVVEAVSKNWVGDDMCSVQLKNFRSLRFRARTPLCSVPKQARKFLYISFHCQLLHRF